MFKLKHTPRDTNLVDKRKRRQCWRAKVSRLLTVRPLKNFRHNFGEGHLNFGTPKRKGHENLDYLRQPSTQSNNRLYGGKNQQKVQKR